MEEELEETIKILNEQKELYSVRNLVKSPYLKDSSIQEETKSNIIIKGTNPRYMNWEGNFTFICDGHIVLGVHYNILIFTSFLVIFTWVIFLGVISPISNLNYSFTIGVILFAMNISILHITALTEPGVIPRNYNLWSIENMPSEIINHLDFCNICNIIKFPRTKHCRYCNSCVSGFDHHCPVMLF